MDTMSRLLHLAILLIWITAQTNAANLFTCCQANGATHQGPSSFTNGWLSINLPVPLQITGNDYSTAMLSNTGFLFFNESAAVPPPTCYNFTLLDNRPLIPAFSLFSETLILNNGGANSGGKIYVEQFTAPNVPTDLKNAGSVALAPFYALLISFIKTPLGNINGPKQTGQLAFLGYGYETEVIFKYHKYDPSSGSCKIGAILHTADVLDIRGKQARADAAVAKSTHVLSVGQNITNTEPLNTFPFLTHNKIPFFQSNTSVALGDDQQVQISMGSNFTVFNEPMSILSMADNGYINLGPPNIPYPDQYCIPTTTPFLDVVYLMALNYDFAPQYSTGAVYYNVTTDGSILSEIAEEVCAWNDVFDNCAQTYQPQKAVIVTYSGHNAVDQTEYGNTFQIVVASDDEVTFGIIIYGVILGYQGDSDCQQWRGAKYANSTTNIIKEIGTTPNSHDEIYAAQHYTNALTTGRYVISLY